MKEKGWSYGTSKSCGFLKNTFFRKWQLWGLIAPASFEVGAQNYIGWGFNSGLTIFANFIIIRDYVFFFAPPYNFRVKRTRAKIIFLTQNFFRVHLKPTGAHWMGFSMKTFIFKNKYPSPQSHSVRRGATLHFTDLFCEKIDEYFHLPYTPPPASLNDRHFGEIIDFFNKNR